MKSSFPLDSVLTSKKIKRDGKHIFVIKKKDKQTLKQILQEKLKKKPSRQGNLSKHFGKLKRGLDGLQYQTSLRENED